MPKPNQDHPTNVGLTDTQLEKIAEILQTYIKIKALSAVNTSTKSEVEKSIWILTKAKFDQQKEITKILHVSDHTVREVLKGKRLRSGETEVAE